MNERVRIQTRRLVVAGDDELQTGGQGRHEEYKGRRLAPARSRVSGALRARCGRLEVTRASPLR